MSEKKLITVFGATGAQGGSVAAALLKDRTFSVRAVTRDTSKPAAEKLKEAGAEVVAADLDDEQSVEAALRGSYGAFLVTNFLEHFNKEKEVAQGKRVADVSKRLGLQLMVFSSLEHVKKLTNGKLEVPHFDSKGEVEEYFREIAVPMASVWLPFYFENFLNLFKLQKDKDGDGYTLALPLGDCPMDGISVKDLGEVVLSIFLSPAKYVGQAISLATERLTLEEYVTILSRGLCKNIKYLKISPEEYEKRGLPGDKAIANMFRYLHIKAKYNKDLTLQLNPKAKTFQAWVEAEKAYFDYL